MRMRIQHWAMIAAFGGQTATALHAQVRLERPPAVRAPAPIAGPPAPAGVTVTGTPAQAHVRWGSVGASSYSVQRWMQTDPSCCRANSPTLAATDTTWTDPVQWKGTYVYRVSAIYPDGRQAFVDVNYVRPEPTNPDSVFVTKHSVLVHPTGAPVGPPVWYEVTMSVNWLPVPGAAYYMVWGPGIANTGVRVDGNPQQVLATLTNTGWGLQTYTVGAFFLPGPVSTAAADFARGSLNVSAPLSPASH